MMRMTYNQQEENFSPFVSKGSCKLTHLYNHPAPEYRTKIYDQKYNSIKTSPQNDENVDDDKDDACDRSLTQQNYQN